MNEKDLSQIEINTELMRRLLGITQDELEKLAAEGVLVRASGGTWRLYESLLKYIRSDKSAAISMTDDNDMIVSGKEMTYVLNDITQRRLGQLAQLGVAVKAGRGQWKLKATARNYIDYKESKNTIEDDEDDPRAATVRLKNEQALAMALANAEQMKIQVLAEEVLRVMETAQAIYNNSIDALEGRLTGQLVSATGAKSDVLLSVLKPELNSVRESVSRELLGFSQELEREE